MSEVTPTASSSSDATTPNFEQLVKFLVVPFLEAPESLRIDCEVNTHNHRVLLRVAFEGEEKGRVFGRGGRNIQAIRTVLQAVGKLSGYSVHLDVFGSASTTADSGNERDGGSQGRGRPDRPDRLPPPRPRPRQ